MQINNDDLCIGIHVLNDMKVSAGEIATKLNLTEAEVRAVIKRGPDVDAIARKLSKHYEGQR